MGHHHTTASKHEDDPHKQFHIQPVKGRTNDPNTDPDLTGELPSKLTEGNSLTGEEAVFAQPGPVLEDSQLAAQKVSTSEELDQRAAQLNNQDPSKSGH